MTAAQLLLILANVSFLLVLVAVVVRFVRRPSRENLDIALFFGAPRDLPHAELGHAGPRDPESDAVAPRGALLIAMPLLTLRAILGFTDLPRFVIPAAAALTAGLAIVLPVAGSLAAPARRSGVG